jgi:hypothetical protein
MKKFLQGKYSPKFPEKYGGNPCEIYYRSSWERKFCVYCDLNENIISWESEEKFVPYRSPMDGKIHKYYPDFLIKVKESNGSIKKYMIEIKPKKQTVPPPKPQRQTKRYISEVYEYAKNQAKWEAAREWCADRGYEFKIITEDNLNIR